LLLTYLLYKNLLIFRTVIQSNLLGIRADSQQRDKWAVGMGQL